MNQSGKKLNIVSEDSLDPELKSLTAAQKLLVNDSLLNDEESTDEELIHHFMEHGLSKDAADKALAYRDQAMMDPFFHLFNPAVK